MILSKLGMSECGRGGLSLHGMLVCGRNGREGHRPTNRRKNNGFEVGVTGVGQKGVPKLQGRLQTRGVNCITDRYTRTAPTTHPITACRGRCGHIRNCITSIGVRTRSTECGEGWGASCDVLHWGCELVIMAH